MRHLRLLLLAVTASALLTGCPPKMTLAPSAAHDAHMQARKEARTP